MEYNLFIMDDYTSMVTINHTLTVICLWSGMNRSLTRRQENLNI